MVRRWAPRANKEKVKSLFGCPTSLGPWQRHAPERDREAQSQSITWRRLREIKCLGSRPTVLDASRNQPIFGGVSYHHEARVDVEDRLQEPAKVEVELRRNRVHPEGAPRAVVAARVAV